MADRYFVDESVSPGRVMLTGPEAHHLIHVMRATPGMEVVLFDGSGAEFQATVERVGRSEVELLAGPRRPIDRELPMDVTLAVALPKGDRQRWLVEKAVELGVTRVVPLRTQRGVAQPVEQAIVRLKRAVVEASKQCGRNRLMSVEQPCDWSELIEATADAPCRLLAQPEGFHRGPHLPLPDQRPNRVLLAIGPEGGLTAQEVSMAVLAGWHTVDLGPRILRVETASLLLTAMVLSFPYAAP